MLVGSVKTNIGHLEGAAGVAGLIKTALSIARREIPPSLHFQTPNLPLDELGLQVLQELRPWPGIGTSGASGANGASGASGASCGRRWRECHPSA